MIPVENAFNSAPSPTNAGNTASSADNSVKLHTQYTPKQIDWKEQGKIDCVIGST